MDRPERRTARADGTGAQLEHLKQAAAKLVGRRQEDSLGPEGNVVWALRDVVGH